MNFAALIILAQLFLWKIRMTGLLYELQGDQDYEKAFFVADVVCEMWNKSCSHINGITLQASRADLIKCCDIGSELFLGDSFPDIPGPYKRIAAFLVIGRLYPFFIPTYEKSLGEITRDEQTQWMTRFMSLTIPIIFDRMTVDLGEGPVPLPKWKGFPSAHYRLEFFSLLRWLDNMEWLQGKLPASDCDTLEIVKWPNLARMVLSVSLSLESCHYISELNDGSPQAVMGQISNCMRGLPEFAELDLVFDYCLGDWEFE